MDRDVEERILEIETVAANSVQSMERQLADARLMLRAVVLAAGGSVLVSNQDLQDCPQFQLMLSDEPENGGIRFIVKRD